MKLKKNNNKNLWNLSSIQGTRGHGTRVHGLEFLENIQVELEFNEFEFFEWNSSSINYYYYLFFFVSFISL